MYGVSRAERVSPVSNAGVGDLTRFYLWGSLRFS